MCAAKFARDLIRQRAWDYSATAFACHPTDYEALRQSIIEQHGPAYSPLRRRLSPLLLAGWVSLVRGSTTDTLWVVGSLPGDDTPGMKRPFCPTWRR